MSQITKSMLLLGSIVGTMLFSYADRGVRKKSKNNVILNISTNNSLKNSIPLNLKTGLKFKGLVINNLSEQPSSLCTICLMTYQKGNTIYLIPNRQKVIIPEIKQGYTGMKLIIKSNK